MNEKDILEDISMWLQKEIDELTDTTKTSEFYILRQGMLVAYMQTLARINALYAAGIPS